MTAMQYQGYPSSLHGGIVVHLGYICMHVHRPFCAHGGGLCQTHSEKLEVSYKFIRLREGESSSRVSCSS